MKVTTLLSVAILALETLHTSAAASACSSGIYAALAPLETYPPAVSYCKGQAGKSTVTTTVTVDNANRRRAVMKTTASPKTTKTPTSTLKTSATKTTSDAKAASWSSLVQQAQAVVSTFCSCAGYPAIVTTTSTYTSTPPARTCAYGDFVGQPCQPQTSADVGIKDSEQCQRYCETYSNYGDGCVGFSVDANGECYVNIACCKQF